tara:strand:- start:3480 stop:3995 length:516 start_codon:yes stop_codon:yes gene_type:complete
MLTGSLLMPKLGELIGNSGSVCPSFLKKQCNESIGDISVGDPVVFNVGSNDLVSLAGKSAGWFNVFRSIQDDGGIDQRVGVITQYENQKDVDFHNRLHVREIKPWVRISCHLIESTETGEYNVCYENSISIDASFCTKIPSELMLRARNLVIKNDIENKDLVSFLLGPSIF